MLLGMLARQVLSAAALGLAASLVLTQAAGAQTALAQDPGTLPAGCAWHWQVSVAQDEGQRAWTVSLRFAANGRTSTPLRLPGGWAGLEDTTPPPGRLQASEADPRTRLVSHPAQGIVDVGWRLRAPLAGPLASGVQGTADWFAFAGQALLAVPDDADPRTAPGACISLGAAPGNRPAAPVGAEPPLWLSSHGPAAGTTAFWRLPAGAGSLRLQVQEAVYAGGAWVSQTQVVEGQQLTVARPVAQGAALDIQAWVDAGVQALAAHRRQWPDTSAAPPLTLWFLPMPAASNTAPAGALASSVWHQALVVQGADTPAPGKAGLATAITQALNRLWLQDRFGPMLHAGRDDVGLRRWFSEGLADFLAHRALLRDGAWSAGTGADEYNRQIALWADRPGAAGQPPASPAEAQDAAAARGEWLALHWHSQLRQQGHAGLDALMRGLQLPASQARREGPISAPLATHRLVAALRAQLGDGPLRDVQRVVDKGEPVAVYPTTLGPCFTALRSDKPGGLLTVQPAAGAWPSAPCQGWLGTGLDSSRAAAGGAGQPRTTGPQAKAGARSAGGKARQPGQKGTKAGARPAQRPAGKAQKSRP